MSFKSPFVTHLQPQHHVLASFISVFVFTKNTLRIWLCYVHPLPMTVRLKLRDTLPKPLAAWHTQSPASSASTFFILRPWGRTRQRLHPAFTFLPFFVQSSSGGGFPSTGQGRRMLRPICATCFSSTTLLTHGGPKAKRKQATVKAKNKCLSLNQQR